MKIFIFLFVSLSTALIGQNLEQKLSQLQKENDSLRIELLKCQNGLFQHVAHSLEIRQFSETPQYTRTELQSKLLTQIEIKSHEKHIAALKVIERTDEFVQYCTTLSEELLARAGGLDSLEKNPSGYRDKNIGAKFFIEEKRGAELKSKISDLRSEYLAYVKGSQLFEARIVLKTESLPIDSTKTWEQYKFEGMPLAAIIPILAKFKTDAISSEIAVLQYLNE